MVEKASTQQREPSGPRLISLEIRPVGEKMLDWGTWPREAGPPGPRLSSPGEWEKNTVIARRVGVNMLQFCSVSNFLSHTTLSVKWEVYFSKNCVARLYCVIVMILHAYVDVYVSCVCIVGHGGDYASSSSCCAASMDIPDPLSPLLPIVHRFWQVFRATSRILT